MAHTSEIVEDWWYLVQQLTGRSASQTHEGIEAVAAQLLLASELREYRRWAEEHHS